MAATNQLPPIQLICRTQEGWQMCTQNESGHASPSSNVNLCADSDIVFSNDGNRMAVLIPNAIEIYDTISQQLLTTVNHERVRNVYFSPLNTYLMTYHRRLSSDKHKKNFIVWRLSTSTSPDNSHEVAELLDEPQQVMSFILADFDPKNAALSFSNDERIAARAIKNGILILHGKDLNGPPVLKESMEGITKVSVAPTFNKIPPTMAVFTPPRKGQPANVSIYSLVKTRLFRGATRSFYQVDSVRFLWNRRGDQVLVFASSDVDTSGQSYYGNNQLYLLHGEKTLTARIQIAEHGKLHDVAWHPNSREFVIIDDHPMKISSYNSNGICIHNFGQFARNMIRFSACGRYMWCGGFGNLNGDMDFWDYKNKTHIGYAKDESCRYFEWSPNASSFITARTYPLRMVDNGYRIYKYNGKLLFEKNFDRLYQVGYRPSFYKVYPKRSPSPNSRGKPAPKPTKQSYIPPHMRFKQNGDQSSSTPQKKKRYIPGLGYVDDGDDDEPTLSQQLSSQVTKQQENSKNISTNKKKNRRKNKFQQVNNNSLTPQDKKLDTFWPRGEKFGVVTKSSDNSSDTFGSKKRRRKKKKKLQTSDVDKNSKDSNNNDSTLSPQTPNNDNNDNNDES